MPNIAFSKTFLGRLLLIALGGALSALIVQIVTQTRESPTAARKSITQAPIQAPPSWHPPPNEPGAAQTTGKDEATSSRAVPPSSTPIGRSSDASGFAASNNAPPRKPSVIVVVADESNSPWTTEIMVQELERALVQSARVNTILRSELPPAVKERLGQSSLDLTSVHEIADGLSAHYVVIATCLEAKEVPVGVTGIEGFESSMLRAVVRMQLLDRQTGGIVDSHGFEAGEYTRVLGGARIDAAQRAYREMVRRFAGEFVTRINEIIDDQHAR